MSTQLHEQIENSALTSEDKEEFLFFLKNISTDELDRLTKLFGKDTSQIVPFWTNLKEKLVFMEFLDENTTFSDETKGDIKQRLSEMSPEEFNIFTATIQKISEGTDPTQEMNALLKQSRKNEGDTSSLTKKLISE